MKVPFVRTALALLVLALLAVQPLGAQQTGVVAGRVVSAETGAPLAGAQVEVLADGQTVAGSLADANGQFRIAGVAPGDYTVRVSLIGFGRQTSEPFRVAVGQTATVPQISLQPGAVTLNPVVVSASKKQEKALDAPARVEVISAREIRERPVAGMTDHLRMAPGLSFATQGIGATNVSARGFNNIFSGALHLITDNRIAAIPSLRSNSYSLLPMDAEDVARIEVVLGPGSALYGPNTANGVVHIISSSPLDEQGSVVSMGAGERSILTGSFRTSQLVSENFGIKLSGRYLQGEEWEHTDPVEQLARQQAIARGDVNTRIGLRDYDLQQYAFEARADWRLAPEATAVVSTGRSVADGLEMTGIGTSQVVGWAYQYYQARFNWNRLFAQAYLNTSDAGGTYNLRDDLQIIDNSKLFVAQLQHGLNLGERQEFTYGLDYFSTMPETGGTIHGVNEQHDNVTEIGAYLQSQTALSPKLDVVLAGRIDDHSELQDQVFSPRAALVFKPSEEHTLRATYNRAFSTPGALNFFLDINSGLIPHPQLAAMGYGLRLQGNRGGWSFRDETGNYLMRSPFTPAALGGPGQAFAVNPSIMYQLAVGFLQATGRIDAGTAALLGQLSPMAANVGIMALDLRDPNNPRPLTDATLPDIDPLTESTNQTFEAGYKGILGGRVLFAADAWYSQIDNFISGVELSSNLLLLNGQDLGQMFVQAGLPQAMAAQLATGMAQIPLGTISPANLSLEPGQTDVLLTYQNFGEVELWGADVSAQALLTDEWTLGLTGSMTSEDRFRTEGRNVWLNAPLKRFTSSLGYRSEQLGLNGEFRVRYTDAFPASSGVHVATRCVETENVVAEPCIDAYTLLDLTAGYRIPGLQGTSLQLSVTNLLDEEYRSFAGVPNVGRLALLRIRREF